MHTSIYYLERFLLRQLRDNRFCTAKKRPYREDWGTAGAPQNLREPTRIRGAGECHCLHPPYNWMAWAGALAKLQGPALHPQSPLPEPAPLGTRRFRSKCPQLEPGPCCTCLLESPTQSKREQPRAAVPSSIQDSRVSCAHGRKPSWSRREPAMLQRMLRAPQSRMVAVKTQGVPHAHTRQPHLDPEWSQQGSTAGTQTQVWLWTAGAPGSSSTRPHTRLPCPEPAPPGLAAPQALCTPASTPDSLPKPPSLHGGYSHFFKTGRDSYFISLVGPRKPREELMKRR